ncbi:hypothetical protein D3C86_1724510 [compost metagenome]
MPVRNGPGVSLRQRNVGLGCTPCLRPEPHPVLTRIVRMVADEELERRSRSERRAHLHEFGPGRSLVMLEGRAFEFACGLEVMVDDTVCRSHFGGHPPCRHPVEAVLQHDGDGRRNDRLTPGEAGHVHHIQSPVVSG